MLSMNRRYFSGYFKIQKKKHFLLAHYAGTQTLGAYIDKRQTTVAEWVALRPILNLYNRDTGYKGGGSRREMW